MRFSEGVVLPFVVFEEVILPLVGVTFPTGVLAFGNLPLACGVPCGVLALRFRVAGLFARAAVGVLDL